MEISNNHSYFTTKETIENDVKDLSKVVGLNFEPFMLFGARQDLSELVRKIFLSIV